MKEHNKYKPFLVSLLLFVILVNTGKAQIHTKAEYDSINYVNDSLKTEIVNLGNFGSFDLKDDSLKLINLSNEFAKKRQLYQKKLDSNSHVTSDLQKELSILKNNSKSLEEDSSNLKNNYKKLSIQITKIKPSFELTKLRQDSLDIVNEIEAITEQLKSSASINYLDSIKIIDAYIITQKKYLIDFYKKQLAFIDTSSTLDRTDVDKLNIIKIELLNLGIDNNTLADPVNYESYYKKISKSKNQLKAACNKKEIEVLLNELNSKGMSITQNQKISEYKNLLENYSAAIDYLSIFFSADSRSKIYGRFGSPAPEYQTAARKQIEDLLSNKDYTNYPFILNELTRLKNLVSVKEGAANNNFKCN